MTDFTDLILLVGTNPLPNYVVAEYFLSQDNSIRKIWLVCSEKTNYQAGTEELAVNLKALLDQKHSSIEYGFVYISDISNAKAISQKVNEELIAKVQDGAQVHLNYTGGTKVMVNHIYRTIERVERLKTTPESFSYLDARNFCILSDTGTVIAGDLHDKVRISFEDLINLHGFERKNKYSKSIFTDAISAFKELIDSDCLGKYFDVNDQGYNRKLFLNKKGSLAEKLNNLIDENKEILRKYNCNDSLKKVMVAMPEDCKLFKFDNGCNLNENIGKKFEKTIKFIDGRWFEEYVYEILIKKLIDKIEKEYIGMNWEIRKPEENWNGITFELDVILMNGYQLIGISCTTDDNAYAKNKGFEIMLRTRQIGGDEAKAVLLTMASSSVVDKLQKQLRLETGGSDNILVLGYEHLKEDILFDKIDNFIKQ
jgi:hypothetical protein